jgi:hypothetical protein
MNERRARRFAKVAERRRPGGGRGQRAWRRLVRAGDSGDGVAVEAVWESWPRQAMVDDYLSRQLALAGEWKRLWWLVLDASAVPAVAAMRLFEDWCPPEEALAGAGSARVTVSDPVVDAECAGPVPEAAELLDLLRACLAHRFGTEIQPGATTAVRAADDDMAPGGAW